MRDRRRFLKITGGASLSLPWFASQATASPSSERKPPRRLAFFYVPIGVVRKAFFPGEANALLPAGNNFDPKKITGRESVKLGIQTPFINFHVPPTFNFLTFPCLFCALSRLFVYNLKLLTKSFDNVQIICFSKLHFEIWKFHAIFRYHLAGNFRKASQILI